MRKAEQLWNRLAEKADLSDEAMPGQTIVEITGFDRVLIENHRGVKAYQKDKILVAGKNGCIHVCGRDLYLAQMSREVLVIRGDIQSVRLQRRE